MCFGPRTSGARRREPGGERNLGSDQTNGEPDVTNELERAGDETGQATKGTWWMPRHQKLMKDVATCEMLRGAGRERRSVDVRMGQPPYRHG